MIIVEGPDGGGKTTLAKRLATDLRKDYRRYSKLSSTEGPDMGILQWWNMQFLLRDPDKNRGIYDRSPFISELVYRPARDLPVRFPAVTMIDGIMKTITNRAIVIFCIPPTRVIEDNVFVREPDRPVLEGLTEERLRTTIWMYHGLAAMWPAALHYDYTDAVRKDDPYTALLETIKAREETFNGNSIQLDS